MPFPLQKWVIFNIYHVFSLFMKLRGCRFLFFFSLCDVRNEAVLMILEHSSLRGVKEKKNEKNMKFWPLTSYYKRSNWKTWLSERSSEALTSKLWNKKNTCCRSLQKWSEIELYSPPMVLSKTFNRSIQGIATWNSKEQIKSAILHEQNYAAWLIKSGKTVFSKLTRKICLSVSGEQAAGKQALGLWISFLRFLDIFQSFRLLF